MCKPATAFSRTDHEGLGARCACHNVPPRLLLLAPLVLAGCLHDAVAVDEMPAEATGPVAGPITWATPFDASGGWSTRIGAGGASVMLLWNDTIEHRVGSNETLTGFDLTLEYQVLDPEAQVTWTTWCRMPGSGRACPGPHPLSQTTGPSPQHAAVEETAAPPDATIVLQAELTTALPWRGDADPLQPDFHITGELVFRAA